jgi:hypothetical protein
VFLYVMMAMVRGAGAAAGRGPGGMIFVATTHLLGCFVSYQRISSPLIRFSPPFLGIFGFGKARFNLTKPKQVTTTFKDVAGLVCLTRKKKTSCAACLSLF